MEVVTRIMQSPYPHFLVLDHKGEMVGVLSAHDLQGAVNRLEELSALVLAADLMTADVHPLTTRDNAEKRLVEEKAGPPPEAAYRLLPPQTKKNWPVMYPASFAAKKATARPISSG